MTHQASPPPAMPANDPGRQFASLREVLGLVRALHGGNTALDDDLLDEAARVSDAYTRATPIAQRRFDALAGEMEVWAAAGVEALLAGGGAPAEASARHLGEMIEDGLMRLEQLLRR